jgi:hypothetical protein
MREGRGTMRRPMVVCGVIALLAFGASAVPVFGADNGR